MSSSSWTFIVLLLCYTMCHATESKVMCSTSAGDFTVTLNSMWSPLGVQRFLELIETKFFDNQLLYRVIDGFIVQWGLAADPTLTRRFNDLSITDEPAQTSFKEGVLSFAGKGPDTRSCHMFVALDPHGPKLGNAPHETPIGMVDAQGIATFKKIVANHKAAGYPDTGFLATALQEDGNSAAIDYPLLDKIHTCTVLTTDEPAGNSIMLGAGGKKSRKPRFVPPSADVDTVNSQNFNDFITFSKAETMYLVQFGVSGIDSELNRLAPVLKDNGISVGYFDCKSSAELCDEILGDVSLPYQRYPATMLFGGAGPATKNIGAGRVINIYETPATAMVDAIIQLLAAQKDIRIGPDQVVEEEEEEEEEEDGFTITFGPDETL